MPAVGDTLGRYELLARLRAGGMATLYLGKHVGAAGFARPIAIKVIHPHLAGSPRFVRMFVDEATLSAKIDDPHVVHVEELGESNGTYFLVMEYVDGASLAELLRGLARRKRALSVELATWVATQIAQGLHAAHEATSETGEPLGIVHRDVSPHNVLLAFKGHVKLIDFGIAKARGRQGDTQTGSLRGKLAYMPPEQAFGKSVDRRADVYALGVVLWEMLTMRRLFEADNEFALLERVRRPEIRPPSALVPGIPPALDEVVMAALAVDPDARPKGAEELRALLVAAVPGANGKTAQDLAAVIHAVMPEEMKRARERLIDVLGDVGSRSYPSIPIGLERADEETLATMTVTMPTAAELFEEESERAAPVEPLMAERRAEVRRGPRRLALLVSAGAAVALLAAIGATVTMRRAAPPNRTGSAEAAPVDDEREPNAVPASSTEAVPATPSTVASNEAVAPHEADGSTAEPAGAEANDSAPTRVRRSPSRKKVRPAHPASTPTPKATASVEMHGGTPIFNKSL